MSIKWQVSSLFVCLSLLTVTATLAKTTQAVPAQPFQVSTAIATNNDFLPTPFNVATPTNCTQGPEPMTVQPEVGPVVGGYPAWATGFIGPHAHLIVSVPRGVMSTRYGWANKVLWSVKNSYTGQVNIRGNNLADNSPLWFENIQDGNAPTTTLLTIDASHPNTSASGFTDYGARMYIAHSGCYQLMVTWDGGDWRIIFAAELVDAFQATISPTP